MTAMLVVCVLAVAAFVAIIQLRAHRVARAARPPRSAAPGRRPSSRAGLHDGWFTPLDDRPRQRS